MHWRFAAAFTDCSASALRLPYSRPVGQHKFFEYRRIVEIRRDKRWPERLCPLIPGIPQWLVPLPIGSALGRQFVERRPKAQRIIHAALKVGEGIASGMIDSGTLADPWQLKTVDPALGARFHRLTHDLNASIDLCAITGSYTILPRRNSPRHRTAVSLAPFSLHARYPFGEPSARLMTALWRAQPWNRRISVSA